MVGDKEGKQPIFKNVLDLVSMARFIKLTKKGNACGHDGMEVWVKVSTIICITRDKVTFFKLRFVTNSSAVA